MQSVVEQANAGKVFWRGFRSSSLFNRIVSEYGGRNRSMQDGAPLAVVRGAFRIVV